MTLALSKRTVRAALDLAKINMLRDASDESAQFHANLYNILERITPAVLAQYNITEKVVKTHYAVLFDRIGEREGQQLPAEYRMILETYEDGMTEFGHDMKQVSDIFEMDLANAVSKMLPGETKHLNDRYYIVKENN